MLLILTASAGCTTNINGDFCLIYEPIYADYEHDTPETIRQIDRNNLVYDEICMKTQQKVAFLFDFSIKNRKNLNEVNKFNIKKGGKHEQN